MTKDSNHQAHLELVLNAVNMGTWDMEFATNTMEWDQRMYHLFDVSKDGFGGRYEDFLNLIHEDDRERVAMDIASALKSGSDYDDAFRIVWPSDGSIHLMRIRSKIFCDAKTKSECMTGACWDVSEHTKIEEELAKERFLLRSLMENIPDNIYFKDKESRFIRVNNAMASWFEIKSPADFLGKTDFDFFNEEHARKAFEDEQKIIQTGCAIVNKEEKETWRGREETWVTTTKLPLRDLSGHTIGTFGLSRDITSRKKIEQQLAQFAEELRQRNETLEEDLKMARELQNAMLPQQYPRFPATASEGNSRVQFYHYYIPSMLISGDFFDVFKISDTMAGVFICDVMGHGVRAALVAAMLRTLVSELHGAWKNPEDLLGQLNQMLCGTLKNSLTPMFASAFYLVIDLEKGELHYANAGHPHPLQVRHSDQSFTRHELNGVKPGPALGLFEKAQFKCCRSELRPQDVILLFTDGLFEVEGAQEQFYDYFNLLKAVDKWSSYPTRELCNGLINEIQQFSLSKEFTDDMCLLAIEVKPAVKSTSEYETIADEF